MGRLQADTSWTTCRSLEMKALGVAAMLDIGRISVRGSVRAHSSIYRRHQRSARTKASTISLVLEHWSRANPGWRWRTVLADSDGLAIATQDTIHPPKILGKSKCMSTAILAILAIRSGLCFICTPSAHLARPAANCSRPVERTRPLLSLRSSKFYKTCCHPTKRVCMPFTR